METNVKVKKLLYLDRAKEESQAIFLQKFNELFGFGLSQWQEKSTTKVESGEEFVEWSDENVSVGLTAYAPERVYARPGAVKNGVKPIMDHNKQTALHQEAIVSLNGVFSELFGVTYSAWSTSEYLKQRIRRSYC